MSFPEAKALLVARDQLIVRLRAQVNQLQHEVQALKQKVMHLEEDMEEEDEEEDLRLDLEGAQHEIF